MKRVEGILFTGLSLILIALASRAIAQDAYPTGLIRLITPYGAGASADPATRLLAQKLGAQMSINVIVEGKVGAATEIANEFVAKSRPDGHTVLINDASLIVNRAFGVEVNYEIFRDLVPVSHFMLTPLLLVVNPSVPVNTLTEFIAHVRANPDKLAYGYTGLGTSNHFGPMAFLQANGLKAIEVPYAKGGTAAFMIDVVAGRIQWAVASMPAVMPLLKDKRIKVLATGNLQRSALLPDVPTIAETMPGFEMVNWYGVMVPSKTPRPVVNRLNREVVRALQDPELRSRLAEGDITTTGSTPEAYGAYLRKELDRWTKVVKTSTIKVE